MGCTGSAWAWLGSNSGQIQIIIGLFALWFAYIAYRKVLDQIKISNDQTKLTQTQIMGNLKINTLDILYLTIDKMVNNLSLIHKHIYDLEDCRKKIIDNIYDFDFTDLDRRINELKEAQILLKTTKQKLEEKLDKIIEPTFKLNDDNLYQLYGILTTATDAIYKSKSLELSVEKFKKRVEVILNTQ